MVEIKMLNPPNLHHPVGPYSQVSRVRASSELIFIAGQTATDVSGNLVGPGDLEAQCRQIFLNLESALTGVGATWTNVVHFTNYLINREDQPRFAKFRLGFFPNIFPNGFPPNTILFVDELLHKDFLLEVQAIAAI
jgi:enamine deaminase RidA (YjgF/YER057c/UK114 family)